MKNDAQKYALLGALGWLLLIALGVVLMWLADNVFNGVVLDFLESLVSGVNSETDAVLFQREKVSAAGFAFVFVVSALIAAAGAYCAYAAHKKQKILLENSRAEAARARENAEREMQRKSDLITYLAHDLKTPLASVIAYLSLLTEAPELSAEQRAKYTGIALDKAFRLEQLTGELFEIIRFNLQTIELDRKEIKLKMMLMQLADEFYPMLLSRNMGVNIDCGDSLTVYGDPDKLARVFNNILKNAVAYGGDGAAIDITARKDGKQTVMTFSNSGARIPKEKLDRIFEKFYRADDSRSTSTGGAGLGLAIAREIVEAHGGAINAESTRERTAFTVTLPDR